MKPGFDFRRWSPPDRTIFFSFPWFSSVRYCTKYICSRLLQPLQSHSDVSSQKKVCLTQALPQRQDRTYTRGFLPCRGSRFVSVYPARCNLKNHNFVESPAAHFDSNNAEVLAREFI
jgi:hypothetical protein